MTQTTLGNVLIAGGASGLGAAAVRAVQRHGGTPLVIDVAKPSDGCTPSDGSTPPEEIRYAWADLADTATVEPAVRELADSVDGRLHAVFTPAGIDSCGRLDTVPAKDWERVVHVNLLGTAAVVRATLPYLKATRGRIVTCASTLGIKALSDATAYCASKFGVVGFSRALAAELAGEVGVTLLIPGGMQTPFFDGRPEQYKPPPDAKLNDPGHVAEAVIFALSQPAGSEIREMVVCSSEESSWP